MRIARLLTLVVGLALVSPLPGCAQDRPASAASDAASTRDRAESLAATGDYEAALNLLDAAAGTADVADLRGRLLRKLGRLDEAEAAFRSSDSPLARLGLGEHLWFTGRRAEAELIFDSFIDLYNRSAGLTSEELAAIGTAVTYLGRKDPSLFHDAVRAYEEAIDADRADPEPKVRLAELFLDKFDSRTAGSLLDEALAVDSAYAPALLAKARRARFDGSSDSFDFVRAALEINPHYAEAKAFLAELHLEIEEIERARRETREALGTNPASLPALTALAAAAHLEGDTPGFEQAVDRVLAIDPQHASLYVTLEHVAYRTRRYRDARRFAERAVALDPSAWAGYAALGMNQLRLGEMEEGRRTLEAAFAGDPFNLWVKNTLDLLDELEDFDTVTSEHFVIRTHPDQTPVMSIYAARIAEEAYERLAARYEYEPPGPITLEMYDRHADFSVRTFGLAGIGALGVSFGSVLAMDAPGARPGEHFNWGSTLWHETSHAFVLGLTEHRVPRWLAEGLAVLDERRARPGWGSDVDPGFLTAFADGRLAELERFDMGFVRPSYRGQVGHSYYLASLLCEWIEDEHGIEAIRAMLRGFRDGLSTEEVFREALGSGIGEVESELHAMIRAEYGTAIRALQDETFQSRMQQAAALRSSGNDDGALVELQAARALFPQYVGPGSPILAIARLEAERGNDEAALAAYGDYTADNENDLEARLEMAGIQRRIGDIDGMRRTLESSVWIDPFGLEPHQRLAEAYERDGRWDEAAVERRALLGLEPTDRAAAWYELGRALHGAGQLEDARSAVLRALDVAPGYEEALDLLLTIREGGR